MKALMCRDGQTILTFMHTYNYYNLKITGNTNKQMFLYVPEVSDAFFMFLRLF